MFQLIRDYLSAIVISFTGIVEILEVDFTTGEVFSNGETTNCFSISASNIFVDMLLIMIYKVFIMDGIIFILD